MADLPGTCSSDSRSQSSVLFQFHYFCSAIFGLFSRLFLFSCLAHPIVRFTSYTFFFCSNSFILIRYLRLLFTLFFNDSVSVIFFRVAFVKISVYYLSTCLSFAHRNSFFVTMGAINFVLYGIAVT